MSFLNDWETVPIFSNCSGVIFILLETSICYLKYLNIIGILQYVTLALRV